MVQNKSCLNCANKCKWLNWVCDNWRPYPDNTKLLKPKTKVINKNTQYVPKDAVYIGRPSKWGNPFIIGRDGNREEVIQKYDAYLDTRPDLLAALPELKGKTLVCFCKPLPCHGDVLKRRIDNVQ